MPVAFAPTHATDATPPQFTAAPQLIDRMLTCNHHRRHKSIDTQAKTGRPRRMAKAMPEPPAPPPPRLLPPQLIYVRASPDRAATAAATTAAPLRCFLQSPLPPHTELLPALRLPYFHPDTGGLSSPSPSPFLHSLVLSPFWLDPTLAYLAPEEWLRLEATCHRLARAVPDATGAWRGLDLGPVWAGASARRKRREAIARRAAMGRVRRAWEGIEAFALPGLKWTLNPGLTEGEVRTLEVRLLYCDGGLCNTILRMVFQSNHPEQRTPTPLHTAGATAGVPPAG